jgi:predicted nucleic acid-binding protein
VAEIMFLLDTNIILEYLLDQDKSDEVEKFFKGYSPDEMYLSEFSLYSLGIICSRRGKENAFLAFVDDTIISSGLRILRLDIQDYVQLVQVQKKFGLDFDDAYQYSIADKYDLIIVSYDSDFNVTERKCVTPSEVLR